MKKRTQEEINRQIEGLTKMKDTLPEYSKLGNLNHKIIDAQILFLKEENLPEEWEDELDWGDELEEILTEAQEAIYWLSGEREEDLFE